MDCMEAIRSRRAVRDFSDRPVEKAVVARLVDSAIQAPSAMNLQPWAFASLQGSERVRDCGERAKKWLLANFEKTPFARTSESQRMRQILEDKERLLFYNAPALVIVLAKSADSQAAEDCCLAAQNLMLAARADGIGTCWIGFSRPWLDLPATKNEFGIPEKYHVVAPIVLGYPKAWPEAHGRTPADVYWLV
jgi:nitroreductase